MEPVNSAYSDFPNYTAIDDGGSVVSKNGRIQIIRENNCYTKALSGGEGSELFETGVSNNSDSDSNTPTATKIGNKRCFVVESAPSLLDNEPRKIHKFEQKNESSLTEDQEKEAETESDLSISDGCNISDLDPDQLKRLEIACRNQAIINKNLDLFGGLPPLHMAIQLQQYNLVSVAINNGADLNIICNQGYFPLHYLAESGDKKILDDLRTAFPDMDMNIRTLKVSANLTCVYCHFILKMVAGFSFAN